MQGIAQLIERLELNAKNADNDLDRRFADFALWYFNNIKRIPAENLKSRITFQEDALWILVEIIAMVREEQKKAASGRSSRLFLPSGITFGKPLRADNGG